MEESPAPMIYLNVSQSDLKGFVNNHPDLWMYQSVHMGLLVLMVIIGLVKGFALAILFVRGATNLHERMLKSIMKAPLAFFDSTPAGRVLNRFSKDMDESMDYLNTIDSYLHLHICFK